MKNIITICLLILSIKGYSQVIKDGKLFLNEDGSKYIKITLNTQVWLRSGTYNDGSTVFGYPKKSGTDIGIRRFRIQFMGQLSKKIFIYSQFGQNNFNAISDRKSGFFLHDAAVEYGVVNKKLSIGGGLTAWSGLARFASPAVGSIMGIDAPLYQQSTNDVSDQFLRKLSIYAKGKLGKLDYRISVADPMAFQKSVYYNGSLSSISNFSSKPAKKQINTYLQYQFKDQESNLTPYMTGTYLGTKRVFNVGLGAVFQKDAMWKLKENLNDTVSTNMVQLGADVFYDAPINKVGSAISFYSNFSYFNFGNQYIRNQSIMNPVNGNTNKNILNGSGYGYPAIGTGTVFFTQLGLKLKNNSIGKSSLMPYSTLQIGDFDRLNQFMFFYSLGLNILFEGHTSKLTIAYENRPIFSTAGDLLNRKGNLLTQYQIFFN